MIITFTITFISSSSSSNISSNIIITMIIIIISSIKKASVLLTIPTSIFELFICFLLFYSKIPHHCFLRDHSGSKVRQVFCVIHAIAWITQKTCLTWICRINCDSFTLNAFTKQFPVNILRIFPTVFKFKNT